MTTPHINAKENDFAPAVLMPGDPLRAKRIAEQIMPDARLVTDVRGMLGFTGTYNGKPLSVMGSGMGMPSMSIYATELFKFYGVERIIRVGTCGGISPKVEVGDTVIATGAHTQSSMNELRIPSVHFSAVASLELASKAYTKASQIGANIHCGTVISNDHFYLAQVNLVENLSKYNVLGVEMEAAALYGVAMEFDKQALAIMTVSDHLLDHSKDMDAAQRETKFQTTLELALEAALA